MAFGLTREQAEVIIKRFPTHPQQAPLIEGNTPYLGTNEMVTRVSLFWGAIFFVVFVAWGVEEGLRIQEYRTHPSVKTWAATMGATFPSGVSLPAITLCQ